MKFNSKLNPIRILLLLALLVLPTGVVFAQSPTGDVILFGQNYILESGETLTGSLAVIGGNVTIEEGASIDGDVAVIGGNISIEGDIEGDIAIIGGQANLAATAVVDGNIATIGGNVNQEPGAEVTGDITNNAPPTVDVPEIPDTPEVPAAPTVDVNINPFWNAVGKLGQAVVIAGIGMLLTLFLQPQLDRAANTIVRQPLISGGYGLLAFIVLPVILVVMTLTIILIPVVAVIVLLFPLAWLFGVIALGQEVGDRFAKAINQVWAPVLSTGFGTFLLMLLVGFIELIPCIGWIPSTIVALLGVGATAMTWFGTRNPPGYIPPVTADEIPPAS